MAQIHSSWRAGSANRAGVRIHSALITVELPDYITISALKGDQAAELGRTLVHLGEQVQVLDGSRAIDQDSEAVRLFAEQEGLDRDLLPTLRRLVAYVDSVRANPLNELVLNELRDITFGAQL